MTTQGHSPSRGSCTDREVCVLVSPVTLNSLNKVRPRGIYLDQSNNGIDNDRCDRTGRLVPLEVVVTVPYT